MILVNFTEGDNKEKVYGLHQWDYGQMLRIQGLDLPAAVEIHFSLTDIGGESITRIGTTVDRATDVIIPDSMLENEEEMGKQYSAFAYIYLSNSESGETIKKIEMIVSTRPKPEAWDKPEDQELFHQAIEAVNSAADRAEKAEGNATKSAESARSDSTKTAEDRKKVEELVEMTADIGEQVEAVKQYKEQAATAATNATLSEQAAKSAQEAATQAQTAAETAEDAAEQHALEVAGDKAEVERMAGQVATDKQTVAQDKAEVEKKVDDFAHTAEQAVADVNNAGQTQTERVQAAGNTAIQELNTAKDTAVQAVNSANDAAVQAVNTAGQEQVLDVQEEGKKVIDSIPEDYQTAMARKVDKQQGAENAGKVLGIDQDGNVVPMKQTGGGIDFEKISKLLIKPQTEQAELLQINDSADFPVLEISGQGWTEQDGTTGEQLFDIDMFLGLPLELFESYGNARTLILALEPNTQYTMSTDNLGSLGGIADENRSLYFTIVEDMALNGATTAVFKGKNITQTSDGEGKLKVVLIDRKNAEPIVNKEKWVMLNKGNTAKTYEEYTGGNPSPSPDYLQEIRNSGKYNEETQRYEYMISLMTKNLLDIPDITAETPETAIECNIVQDIFISAQESGTVSKPIWRFQATYKDGTTKYLNDQNEINWTFPATKENPIVKIVFRGIFITSGAYKNIQVEYGTRATSYVPHAEQSVTITSNRPVSKWDRLECRDGVYGWVYRTKFIDDLAEVIPKDTIIYGTDTPYFLYSLEGTDLNYDKTKIITEVGVGGEKYQPKANTKSILININKGDTIETAKEHLHYKVVYETTESEEFVPLQEEEQQALKELCTYYPTTIISTDSGLLLQVNYVADPNNYIENNYEPKTEMESLKERVAALERAAIK